MMKIFLCVMLLVLVTVIEAGWFKGRRNVVKHTSSSSSSRKPQHQQCLGLCLKKHRDHLIEKICPDPCEGINCNGRGVCSNGRCTCQDGFSGCDCQDMIDPCITVVCNNGGSCDSSNGQCTCAMGFEGEFCDVFIDPCAQMECFNGGTCSNGSCECTSRFRGDTCDTAVCTRQVNRGASPAFSLDLGPSISRPTNDLTIDACEASCAEAAEAAETDPCRSYEFVTDVNGAQVCILYATDVLTAGIFNPRFALVSPNGTTVGICDPGLNCRRENVITYLGVPIEASDTIINIDACETICTGISTCGGFVFVSATNFCVLYRNDALLMLASDATVGSCPLVCTRNENMATTEDRVEFDVNNIDDCEVGCNVFPGGCRGYQFLTVSNECFIYTEDISSSLTSNSNATTAICI